jgi:hypothetical protein
MTIAIIKMASLTKKEIMTQCLWASIKESNWIPLWVCQFMEIAPAILFLVLALHMYLKHKQNIAGLNLCLIISWSFQSVYGIIMTFVYPEFNDTPHATIIFMTVLRQLN